MNSVTHEECCVGKDGRTDECIHGQMCVCLGRLPNHLRTDKILFSQPKPAASKILYGSEKKICLHEEIEADESFPPGTCTEYGSLEPPCTRIPSVKCRITGNALDKSRPPVHIGPECTGDWTRFDVTSDVPGELAGGSLLPSLSGIRSDIFYDEGESLEEEVAEICRCDKPFCMDCKFVESSSESLEEILAEKSVSFDDEILEAVDSDMWLNPVAHKKVLQFSSTAHREKYKRDILGKLKHTATTAPRSEWLNNLHQFDHYVTILMGESSSQSSSDYGESEHTLEWNVMRKQRRKKRLMYSVENMKEHPVYNCYYTRQYLSFMEDLKKRSADPPTYEWPRFMKTFKGYGKDPGEVEDPEWMGLLLMAPTECFREISSSSSCESLPHLSDPGSTTTSLSSTECSPSACGKDSTDRLRRAGVCITQDYKDSGDKFIEEASRAEIITNSENQGVFQEFISSSTLSHDKLRNVKSQDEFPVSTSNILASHQDLKSAPSPRDLQQSWSKTVNNESSNFIKTKSVKLVRSVQEKLSSQASELLQSLQSNRLMRAEASSKKLKAELLSEEDEIVVIEEDQLPTSLGINPQELYGEGLYDEEHLLPEYHTTWRNVIMIIRGKLYKLSYDCYCGETCKCDPKQLVEKYMDLMIDEVYKTDKFDDDEDEEEEIDGSREELENDEKDDISNAESIFMSGIPSSRVTSTKVEEEKMEEKTLPPDGIPPKIDRSKAFFRGFDVDPSPRDTPQLPVGAFDKRDVNDNKETPEGILAYKDFHVKGELRKANKCKKRTKQDAQGSKGLSALDSSSDVSDGAKLDDNSDDGGKSSSMSGTNSSNSSSDSSIPLCACCTCEKRYEQDGKIYRRCDRKRCTCCNCKEKIVKVAKKIHTRKKGSRFVYILLKKIRRAINQPSQLTREKYLQSIVDELREEGRRIQKKKWPYYFKELMVMAGLESASDETSMSDNESSNTEKTKRKIRRRRRREPNPTQLTAADLQRREWIEWKGESSQNQNCLSSC